MLTDKDLKEMNIMSYGHRLEILVSFKVIFVLLNVHALK